ncbi:ATP-binding protein [Streptomyces sp. SID10853]|uniref:ATP-binding protein n=1 Tax=Streptomyces sp. SID10853 TaxID=2706028 RepID=UPI0013C039E0|nr:ATP-binding protein [Streptomyces sp. SID10853]NDZ76997.1 ATP-binding protein [Streptomyces sp. SID10853]
MTPAAAVTPLTARASAPAARSFSVAFVPEHSSVARMRRVTRACMRHWRVDECLAGDVVLAVSELVTNSVQHGHGDVGLRVRYDGDELCVEVTDGNPAPAELRSAGDDDVSGRGLFLVAVLAKDWGVSNDGKTTWCTFRVPTGRS